MDLKELRVKIDEIDDEIIKQFCGRMRVSADIARYKMQNTLPVYDPEREKGKLSGILSKTDTDLREYMEALYMQIFELSRSYQHTVTDCAASAPDCAASVPDGNAAGPVHNAGG